MAESTVVKNFTDGTILIEDGTPVTALDYTVAYEAGDFSASSPRDERTVIRDRGAIAGLRNTNEQVGSISFSVHMRQFTDGTDETIIDMIERTGAFSAAVSVGGAAYEPFLHKVTFTVEGTDHSDSADHVMICSLVHLDWEFSEGDPNVINVTGELYARPTFTGPA